MYSRTIRLLSKFRHFCAFACLLVAIAAITPIHAQTRAANLLENVTLAKPQEGRQGWVFYKGRSPGEYDHGWLPEGAGTLFLQNTKPEAAGFNVWWFQTVACVPGVTYRLTANCKSVGSEHKADVLIAFPDTPSGYQVTRLFAVADTQTITPNPYSTEKWQEFSGTFTPPEGAYVMHVRLGLLGKDVSEAWYRNIRLVEVGRK